MNMPNYGIVKNKGKNKQGKNKQGKNKDIQTKNNAHSKQGKRMPGRDKRRKGTLVGRAASPLSRDIFAILCF